jgi:hypothetical protein
MHHCHMQQRRKINSRAIAGADRFSRLSGAAQFLMPTRAVVCFPPRRDWQLKSNFVCVRAGGMNINECFIPLLMTRRRRRLIKSVCGAALITARAPVYSFISPAVHAHDSRITIYAPVCELFVEKSLCTNLLVMINAVNEIFL